jgi:glutamyl-tRNA synthetase
VGKHGSKFDPEKAKWFNHQYIQKMSNEELAKVLRNLVLGTRHSALGARLLGNQERVERVCELIKERVVLLPDLWKNAWFFFEAPESYDEQAKTKCWMPDTGYRIKDFAEELVPLEPFNKDTLHDLVQDFVTRKNLKMGQLMSPLRLLVVGSNQGPGMMDIAEILGKEELLRRINIGIEEMRD